MGLQGCFYHSFLTQKLRVFFALHTTAHKKITHLAHKMLIWCLWDKKIDLGV